MLYAKRNQYYIFLACYFICNKGGKLYIVFAKETLVDTQETDKWFPKVEFRGKVGWKQDESVTSLCISFFFKHLYWSIIALQWCVSFCFITK